MRIVFIHGAPAVGKLTVARALQALVPVRLLDNHAPIAFAKTMFDFNAPGFWPLVNGVRREALSAAAMNGVPLVAMTLCYDHPWDQRVLDEIADDTAVFDEPPAELLPVFLHCPDAVAEARVGAADRLARGKLASVQGRRDFVGRCDFRAVPRENCLSLDTSLAAPEETAAAIVRHFGLDVAPEPAAAVPGA